MQSFTEAVDSMKADCRETTTLLTFSSPMTTRHHKGVINFPNVFSAHQPRDGVSIPTPISNNERAVDSSRISREIVRQGFTAQHVGNSLYALGVDQNDAARIVLCRLVRGGMDHRAIAVANGGDQLLICWAERRLSTAAYARQDQ